MITNQILQNTLDGFKAITKMELCVMDPDGKEVARSGSPMNECKAEASQFARSMADSQEIHGHQYFKIFDDFQVEYILIINGDGEDTYTIGKLAAFQIQSLLVAYKERFDKDNFIKNLLLDNLLLIDIYSRAKKLNIEAEAKRVVIVIETENIHENSVIEIVRTFFAANYTDFVTAVDETNIIIVKDLTENGQLKEIEKVTKVLENYLLKEGIKNILISYGTTINDIKDVSRSYKEAKMAMDIGKIFFDDLKIIAYNQLGIGRLIYQLPIPLCKIFIREIFENKNPDDFDNETLTTIAKFFENSLNVSETSRQLFIHRNTLVYRLDKIQKGTGLDLRVFEDAIIFRIALMVVKYMRYMESFDY